MGGGPKSPIKRKEEGNFSCGKGRNIERTLRSFGEAGCGGGGGYNQTEGGW